MHYQILEIPSGRIQEREIHDNKTSATRGELIVNR